MPPSHHRAAYPQSRVTDLIGLPPEKPSFRTPETLHFFRDPAACRCQTASPLPVPPPSNRLSASMIPGQRSSESLQFRCPQCSTLLQVPPELAGTEGSCPTCATILTAPSPAEPPPARETATPASHRSGIFRPRRRRWIDLSIAAGTAALVAGTAWVSSIGQTQPRPGNAMLPPHFPGLMAREDSPDRVRRAEACALASACLEQIAANPASPALTLPAPEGFPHGPAVPASIPTAELTATGLRRIPGTDRYFVILQNRKDPRSFLIEETSDGPRLHTAALAQQISSSPAGRLRDYPSTPNGTPLHAYVLIREASPQTELAERAAKPGIGGWQLVEIADPFAQDSPFSFVACIDPASPAGQTFSRCHSQRSWNPAVVRLRWHTGGSTDFVELAAFLPSTWTCHPASSDARSTQTNP